MADILDGLTDLRPRDADERAVWGSFNGCDCPTHFSDGKRLRASERCTATAVRCNGRLNTIKARLREMRATPPRAGEGVGERPMTGAEFVAFCDEAFKDDDRSVAEVLEAAGLDATPPRAGEGGCERDHDGDGNCDRHPAPRARVAIPHPSAPTWDDLDEAERGAEVAERLAAAGRGEVGRG